MTTPISLTVHRNTREKRQRRKVWDTAQLKVRTMPKNIDGFVVVYFKKTGLSDTETWADWYVRDTADTFRLPEMARFQIERAINK